MAGADKDSKVFSDSDPFDINELASLNEDISPEFIEQLQSQVSQDAKILNGDNAGEDAALFEEVDSQTGATNSGRKKESKDIAELIDTSMKGMGFRRTMKSQTPNIDESIFRYTLRYTAVVSKGVQNGQNIVHIIYN